MLTDYKKCQKCNNCTRTEYEQDGNLYNELNCSKGKVPEKCKPEFIEEKRK